MKVNLKQKSALKNEQVTARILLVVGGCAFLFSVLMEFGLLEKFVIWIAEKIARTTLINMHHKEYITNVALGISGSSIISFISIIFLHMQKKNEQINDILAQIKEIFCKYYEINLSISSRARSNDQDNHNRYENKLQYNTDYLIGQIQKETIAYSGYDFESDGIRRINDILAKKIKPNLLVIRHFCNMILLIESSQKSSAGVSVVYKRAAREYYKYLLETIESNYSLEDLKKEVFSLLNMSLTDYQLAENILIEHLTNFKSDFDDMTSVRMEILIQSGIFKIWRKNSDAYDNECEKIQARLYNIFQKLESKKEYDMQYFLTMHDKILGAIRGDNLTNAEEMLIELEEAIESLISI